jgi:hypothetical protein
MGPRRRHRTAVQIDAQHASGATRVTKPSHWRTPLKAFVTLVLLAAGAALAAAPTVASADGVLTAETAGGLGTSPGTLTGTITVGGLSPGARFQLVNAYQLQPDTATCSPTCTDRFLPGTYRASFDHCVGGTIEGEAEVIGQGGTYTESPGVPPENSSPFTLALAQGSTFTACDYSVSVTQSPIDGSLSSVESLRLDVWVVHAGQVLGRMASPSIRASWRAEPTALAGPPFAALLPASALLVMGGALVLLTLRRPSRSA